MRHAPLLPVEFSSRQPKGILNLLAEGLYRSRRARAEQTLLRHRDKIAQAQHNIRRELYGVSKELDNNAHEVCEPKWSTTAPPSTVKIAAATALTVTLLLPLLIGANWQEAYLMEMIHSERTNLIGYLAAGLVLSTFCMQSMGRLRVMALASNLAFIGYGYMAGLMPVLVLHAILLPVNAYRLLELSGINATSKSA